MQPVCIETNFFAIQKIQSPALCTAVRQGLHFTFLFASKIQILQAVGCNMPYNIQEQHTSIVWNETRPSLHIMFKMKLCPKEACIN